MLIKAISCKYNIIDSFGVYAYVDYFRSVSDWQHWLEEMYQDYGGYFSSNPIEEVFIDPNDLISGPFEIAFYPDDHYIV